MKKTILLFCLLFAFSINEIYAQYSMGMDSLFQQKINSQVKQISQFFDRFNFKEPVILQNGIEPSRKLNLVSLFNLSDSKIKSNPETIEFLKLVANESNHLFMKFGDSSWYAVAHCSFTYKNKNFPVAIILQTEGFPGNGYRWVMAGIKSSIFSFVEKQDRANAFINPMNHEIGFTELSKALEEKNNLIFYTSQNYHPDGLSTFLVLIQSGDLVLSKIDSIEYQFLQIPGWAFIVKDFNRADYNSGWLIASLLKMDDEHKIQYKNKELKN